MPRDVAAGRNTSSKGVEFSDELIVLGASATTPIHTLPKGSVFVHRGAVAQAESISDPCADQPGKPRSLSEHFEHTKIEEETPLPDIDHAHVPQLHIPPGDVVLRPPGKRKARFFPDEELTIGLATHHACNNKSPHAEDDEPLETSCTDSDASAGDAPPRRPHERAPLPFEYPSPESEEMFQESTRINTKLNSMPSGGTFSFMNSSEDIVSDRLDTSESELESESSSDDEDLRSSRRMIRVDGSAKLSSASGLADEDFMVEDDEFGIEGAEKVEEEEAIQVRSFGRSFARVSLKDGEDVIIRDPRKKDKPRSEVAFALPESQEGNEKRRSSSTKVPDRPREEKSEDGSGHELSTCRSDPPRRKSRLRMTFTKRAGTANAVRNAERKSMERKSVDGRSVDRGVFSRQSMDRVLATRNMEPEVELSSESEAGDGPVASCFPTRKTTQLKQGSKSARSSKGDGEAGGSGSEGVAERQWSLIGWRGRKASKNPGQLVAIPDMSRVGNGNGNGNRTGGAERKIVKNVSLQQDDWIDFATNAARGQRHPWFVRVLSNNRGSSSSPSPAKPLRPTAAQTDPDMNSRKKSKRFWRVFSRKGKGK